MSRNEEIKVILLNNEEKFFFDFIKEFSEAYFYVEGNKKINGIRYVQSNFEKEKEVLEGKFEDREVFGKMMAWKMGKIKKNGGYYKHWENCETANPKVYNYNEKNFVDLKLDELHEEIRKNKAELDDYIIKRNPIQFVEKILSICKEKGIKGIGPVYAITILFFMSGGKYPIYDRFAHVALNCIFPEENECQHVPKPGESNSLKFNLEDYYDYYKKMEKVHKLYYGDKAPINYMKKREVDRAFWVYGHGYKGV